MALTGFTISELNGLIETCSLSGVDSITVTMGKSAATIQFIDRSTNVNDKKPNIVESEIIIDNHDGRQVEVENDTITEAIEQQNFLDELMIEDPEEYERLKMVHDNNLAEK